MHPLKVRTLVRTIKGYIKPDWNKNHRVYARHLCILFLSRFKCDVAMPTTTRKNYVFSVMWLCLQLLEILGKNMNDVNVQGCCLGVTCLYPNEFCVACLCFVLSGTLIRYNTFPILSSIFFIFLQILFSSFNHAHFSPYCNIPFW